MSHLLEPLSTNVRPARGHPRESFSVAYTVRPNSPVSPTLPLVDTQ